MFVKFSEEAQKVLKKAKVEMQDLKHAFVGSEHLVLSILNSNNNLCKFLNKYNISYDLFKNELINLVGIGSSTNNYLIYTPLLKRVLVSAIMDARDENLHEVSVENIFLALLDEGEGVANRIFYKLGANIDEMYQELNSHNTKGKSNKKLSIYEYGVDLNKEASENHFDPLIGRDKEILKLVEILCRKNKNNPLLIGEAGVGKTSIVEGLAKLINEGNVPSNLLNYKIVSLTMSSLVAGTKYRGEFEERINKLLKETEGSNIILFIDEIHTIVGAGGAEGAIDASNIIKPSLARGRLRLIGATTINEYKETIAKDKALSRRFQTVMVNEPNLEETENILLKIKDIYENYHHVEIKDNVIKKLVLLTDKYIHNRKNPDKSIDILDEVCAKCSLMKNKNKLKLDKLNNELKIVVKNKNNLIVNGQFKEASSLKNKELVLENKINNLLLNCNDNIHQVTINEVAETIKEKSSIPVYDILHDDIERLNELEKYLKNKIIGQDNAINELVNITKKYNLGLRNSTLPISILFQGSTGVGKTMLVKEYAKFLKLPLIRLDMSEYREDYSISKIIGSPPGYVGYEDYNNVLEKINNQPYSIILLDEIEKASKNVINLFLQILDEGKINDSKGNTIDFSNTMIFMTSNIGCHKDKIGFMNNSSLNNDLNNELSLEFVNRIEKIVLFNHLKYNDIIKIIDNKLLEIKDRLVKDNLTIKINRNKINELIDKSDYEKNGIRKLLKDIDNLIDEEIINDLIKIDCDNVIIN